MTLKSFLNGFVRLLDQCLSDCNEHETIIRFEKLPDGRIQRVDQICRGQSKIHRAIAHKDPIHVIYEQTSCFSAVADEALESAIQDGLRNQFFTQEQVDASRKRCRNCK